jgi:hypothetical protein
MQVNRIELLAFFDEDRSAHLHASAIKAIAGEELGLALLLRHLRESGRDAEDLKIPCTTGSAKGAGLDAWVQSSDNEGPVLYQVEVKSWSFHSIGGVRLPVTATPEGLAKYKRQHWAAYYDPTVGFRDKKLKKVFTPMRSPRPGIRVEPLACLWAALHPDGGCEPFFRVPISFASFTMLNVFSMSSYLRGSSQSALDLALPNTEARLGYLSRLFDGGA